MIEAIQLESSNLRLRHAVAEDEEFLLRLFKATQPIDITACGMSAPAQDQLLLLLSRGRSQTYQFQYPDAEDLIISLDEDNVSNPVGRHLILQQNDAVVEIDLAILPEYQGRGLGRRVLQHVQRQCALNGLRFRLQVMHTNPARRLYERLGFTVVSQDLLHAHMEWNAIPI